MGYLYQPKLKSGVNCAIWWMKYYVNGKAIRESSGTGKETEARRILKEREGRVAAGQPVLPRADRIRYEEAARDLREHYQVTGSRNLEEAGARFLHLDAHFTSRRLAAIGPADATAYARRRQEKGASNGTINRELAILNRMLRLAQGFFEREPFEIVRRNLSPDLQVAVTIAHTFGWRMQSEVLTLELRQVDLGAATIRLDPGQTKNDEGRLVYLTPELRGILKAQVDRVFELMHRTGRIIPHLFPHLSGRFMGQRIRDFRKAWATACKKAGCRGMLRHDLRRTAVRNLVNAGVPERVAMTVTGHKTRAVFDRYHIVSPADLQEASQKLAGTFSGTFGVSTLDGQGANG
jgi:integrase